VDSEWKSVNKMQDKNEFEITHGEQNKMSYWFPKVEDLDIPMPKTVMVKVPFHGREAINYMEGEGNTPEGWYGFVGELKDTAKEFGYPVFMRTGELSGKHSWKRTCYVENESCIVPNFMRLVEEAINADMIGFLVENIFMREYIEMDSKYTAFHGEMPVSPERRYFVQDGEVICHHEYWILDAIRNPSVENWEELSREMNTETPEEIELLTGYATEIGQRLESYWSVDFCRARTGEWYFIDAALGLASYHPECDKKREII